MTNLNPDDVEQYPLIEVANPNAGAQGKSATMMVFRTWTVNDVKAACEGIPGPEVYAAAFKQGVQGLSWQSRQVRNWCFSIYLS